MPEHRRADPDGRELAARGLAGPLAILLLGLLLITACDPRPVPVAGADAVAQVPLEQVSPLADPRTHVGASTALLSQRGIDPVMTSPSQSLPATVTSYDLGGERTLTVTNTSRVVALDLAGSIAATLWGLGFGPSQVGRDSSTTFPGAVDLPAVTSGGHSVNSEAIIALRPTLVITDGTVGPRDVIEQLRDVGITVVFVRNTPSFDGAADLARQVAAVYGATEAGNRLADRISADVDDTIATIARLAPREPHRKVRMVFLYLRGSAGVYYLFGTESGADQLITALGGIDVAGELGWGGMKPLTDEAILKADPDLILVMTKGLESVGGIAGIKEAKPAIALTKAGQHNRFVDMADGDILSFGPRSGRVLDALARAIYAPGTPNR